MFSEFDPVDSEIILYMLPWLLSINRKECPGYVAGLKKPFRVYDIDYLKKIRHYEKVFKQRFHIKEKGTLLKPPSSYFLIQGIYTIGSVGSIAQGSSSDCDIWICIDKKEFNETAWKKLNEKINLIKDWLDATIRIPVYFFVCDVTDIRECRFGSVDAESCGSTQQNVLKEEFYRTGMLICGKTPIWWLCFDGHQSVEYNDVLLAIQGDGFWEYDLIDFGDIEKIDSSEYFGAALWQLHKSLSNPLKSIIKITLLKILLDAPQERLLCHKFREKVLLNSDNKTFPDYSLFTTMSILEHYRDIEEETVSFLSECYYLLCEMDPYKKRLKTKNKLTHYFLKKYPIKRNRQRLLQNSSSWSFFQQIDYGNRLFKHLIRMYREFSVSNIGISSESDQKDLTILGRKISAHYMKKEMKVPVLPVFSGSINIKNPTLVLDGKMWHVFAGNDRVQPVVSNTNIIYSIGFIAWNNLFSENTIHMQPNASDITLQEVINIGNKIQAFLGIYKYNALKLSSYLKKEQITKILVIFGLETAPWYIGSMDYRVAFTNCWGELFVKRFDSYTAFEMFLSEAKSENPIISVNYYVRRNAFSYEKIIVRSKKLMLGLERV